jgi:DNA replication protein DnaC
MLDDQGEKLEDFDLGGVDCPLCGNTGHLVEKGEELLEIHVKECPCMKTRRSLRSLRKAGMEDMAKRYTFDNYQADTPKRKSIKETAQRFAESDEGWFYIAGQSGSGKTHICTAICTKIMERNSEITFMPWRDDSTAIKTGITDREWYESKIQKLKQTPVLYIDDFLKGGCSEADKRLAFEILNARYNDTRLRTIISSELTLDRVLAEDEATGGRIYERSRGFVVMAPEENWRLR